MEKLFTAIYDIVSNTLPERIGHLADSIRELPGSASAAKLNSWPMNPNARTRLDSLTAAWNASAIRSAELSGMLLGASHVYREARSESDMELVWTGPSSELVATRKTEQALLQVINAARNRLFLTSFVAYDVASIMKALGKAVNRGVVLSMLLKSSDRHGGGASIDSIARVREAFPPARVYCWTEKRDECVGGRST